LVVAVCLLVVAVYLLVDPVLLVVGACLLTVTVVLLFVAVGRSISSQVSCFAPANRHLPQEVPTAYDG
jgi:multisubunit Na+/H+ antiporter MnhC subunit